MQIARVMTTHPMTVNLDTQLSRIKWIFDNHPFRHLIVTDNGKLVGIVSDRDVMNNLSPTVATRKETPKDAALLTKRAHQIMAHNPDFIKASDNIFDAITLFYKKKISCLPVVDEDNVPVGIITTHDVFEVLYEQHQASKK